MQSILAANDFLKNIFVHLAASDLSCSPQDPCWTLSSHATWIPELSSPTRDRTCIPCIGTQILNHWTTREVLV